MSKGKGWSNLDKDSRAGPFVLWLVSCVTERNLHNDSAMAVGMDWTSRTAIFRNSFIR